MKYYVVFNYVNSEGQNGFGSTTLSVKKRIRTMNDIQGVQEFLNNELNFKKTILLNWQQIKG